MNWCLTFIFTITTLCHIATGERWPYHHFKDYDNFGFGFWNSAPPGLHKWHHQHGPPKGSTESKYSDPYENSKEWDYYDGYDGINSWNSPRTTTTAASNVRTTPKPTPRIAPSFTSWTVVTAGTTSRPASTMMPFPLPSTMMPNAACLRSCPVTSEYNPVCGTDDVTYANSGRLECARICGADVQVRAESTCEVANANGNTNTGDNSAINTATVVTPKGGFRKIPSLSNIVACMHSCSLTSEVNPVCGSNGFTYTNPGYLLCAQFCGVDVTIQRMSACIASYPDNNNNNGNIATSPITKVPTTTKNGPLSLAIQVCINSCPQGSENNPVCGSDNVTYNNIGRLMCVKHCGVDVTVRMMSACSPYPNNKDIIASSSATKTPTTNTPTTNTPTTNTPTTNTPTEGSLSPAVQSCINSCPPGSENNPVCGSNNVTYINISRLMCVKYCGVDVTVRMFSACTSYPINKDNIASFPNTNAPNEGSLSPAVQACVNSCPRGLENNPVCGTDNVTYINIGRLMCVKYCGVDVLVRELSACPKTNNIDFIPPSPPPPSPQTTKQTNVPTQQSNGASTQACLNLCPITSEYNPICGTNNITYNNIGRLNCAKNCGINVGVRRLAPCSTTNDNTEQTPITGSERDNSSTTESTNIGAGSTIPKDILDLIFDLSTPMPQQTTTPEESEEFDIDHRFNTQ